MGVAITLQNYLSTKGVEYELIEHDYSEGSLNTASVAEIPYQNLAKAVVLRDEDLHYTMAVLPASNKIRRYTLNQIFDRHLSLAEEDELKDLFNDCEPGAIPVIGDAYNVNVIYDDALLGEDDIYMEAGDHTHLIHLRKDQFMLLIAEAMHDRFSSLRPSLQ